MPSSNPIQRYFPDFDSDEAPPNGQRIEMVADSDGSWIDWDDHLTAMQEQKTHFEIDCTEERNRADGAERRAIEAEAKLKDFCEKRIAAVDAVRRETGSAQAHDVADGEVHAYQEVYAELQKLATLADSDPPEEPTDCKPADEGWEETKQAIRDERHAAAEPADDEGPRCGCGNAFVRDDGTCEGCGGQVVAFGPAKEVGADEEGTDRWPVRYIARKPGGRLQLVEGQHPTRLEGLARDGFDLEQYHPESAPNVLTPEEAAQVAHHLPPDHELWERLFDYAATQKETNDAQR